MNIDGTGSVNFSKALLQLCIPAHTSLNYYLFTYLCMVYVFFHDNQIIAGACWSESGASKVHTVAIDCIQAGQISVTHQMTAQ